MNGFNGMHHHCTASQLFLNYSIYLLPLGFLPLSISAYLLFLLILCVAVWLSGWPLAPSPYYLVPSSSQMSPPLYSLCLPALPILSPALILAV